MCSIVFVVWVNNLFLHSEIVVNLYMFGFGIFQSWSIREYIDNFVYSSFPQLLNASQIIGCILFGLISMKFGRKMLLLYMSIPMIVSVRVDVHIVTIEILISKNKDGPYRSNKHAT